MKVYIDERYNSGSGDECKGQKEITMTSDLDEGLYSYIEWLWPLTLIKFFIWLLMFVFQKKKLKIYALWNETKKN